MHQKNDHFECGGVENFFMLRVFLKQVLNLKNFMVSACVKTVNRKVHFFFLFKHVTQNSIPK